jgi:hypothetical protein
LLKLLTVEVWRITFLNAYGAAPESVLKFPGASQRPSTEFAAKRFLELIHRQQEGSQEKEQELYA